LKDNSPDTPPPPWLVLNDTEVYSAPPWISVHRQQVRLPTGRIVDDYHQIILRDYAVVLARAADGKFITERQYKHGIGKVSLTLPGGVIEPGEEPLTAAKRELLEETGYEADDWRPMGAYVSDASYGCGKVHLFSAGHARRIAQPKSGDLEDMEIVLMDSSALAAAVWNGEILAVSAVAAVAWALNPAISAQVSAKGQGPSPTR
jgi:ADP-ribose pyrophosphatase